VGHALPDGPEPFEPLDFERLELLCRRSSGYLGLSPVAARILEAVDRDGSSIADLERVLSADPYLARSVVRMAGRDRGAGATTLSDAIARVGFNAIRSLALSLSVHTQMGGFHRSKQFLAGDFAAHSIAVGMLARYLYVRRQQRERFRSQWSGDEVFAAGVLHDLGKNVLARALPEVYDRVALHGERQGMPFEDAFESLYQEAPERVGVVAVEAWTLPELFSRAIGCFRRPSEYPEEFTALSCIAYADALAERFGIGATSVGVPAPPPSAEVLGEVALAPEEIEGLHPAILRQVHAFMRSSARRAASAKAA
jgi:HD-like signal output (HDOD) protein